MRIIFVRHGETDWNVNLMYQGQSDVSLNEVGMDQCKALASKFIPTVPISSLYSSDLSRAKQTAEAVSQVLRLPIVCEKSFRERHFGRCEGLTIDEIGNRYPDDAFALKNNIADYVIPDGGESINQFSERVALSIQSLVLRHPHETVVVVTHGGVLDMVYRHMTNSLPESPMHTSVRNTGICSVMIGPDDWTQEFWNFAPHLESNPCA